MKRAVVTLALGMLASCALPETPAPATPAADLAGAFPAFEVIATGTPGVVYLIRRGARSVRLCDARSPKGITCTVLSEASKDAHSSSAATTGALSGPVLEGGIATACAGQSGSLISCAPAAEHESAPPATSVAGGQP